MDHIYQDIPGFFDWQGTYERWVQEVPAGGRIMEVGAFKGRSAAFLAVEAINSGKALEIHCVDTWQGSPELGFVPEVQAGTLYESFLAHTRPVAEALHVHRMPSVEAAALFPDASVDRVWLDGDHSFAGLTADLEAWWPKVKPGGEMGGHDFGAFEVTPALEPWARSRGLLIEVLHPDPRAGTTDVGLSWVIRKAAPVSDWRVPEAERSLLIAVACNQTSIYPETFDSVARMMLTAKEQAAAHGFSRVAWHWETEGANVEVLRDKVAYKALQDGHSHLLSLDADMTWPSDFVARMLAHHAVGVVSAAYYLKHWPHHPVLLRKTPGAEAGTGYHQYAWRSHEARGLQRVHAIGMGAALIPVEVFRQMPRPWFRYQANAENFADITEDMHFCAALERIGCPIYADTQVFCGHLRRQIIGVNNYKAALPAVDEEYARWYMDYTARLAAQGA